MKLAPFIFERMTIPVTIESGPPLSFLIDTGAELSGVTREVANRYGLQQTGTRTVIGVAGAQQVPTVRVPDLSFAHSARADVEVLMFSRGAMGADGFLGLDSLSDHQIEFDFVNGRMRLERAPKRGLRSTNRSVIVRASPDGDRLVFSAAKVNGTKASVILDTGSTVTIGNAALWRQLAAKGRLGKVIPIQVLSVTGKLVTVDYAILRQVMIGDVLIRRLPIAFATVEPFHQLGWDDRPALLLGMDALRAFAAVTVDFRSRAVRFAARNYDRETSVRIPGVW